MFLYCSVILFFLGIIIFSVIDLSYALNEQENVLYTRIEESINNAAILYANELNLENVKISTKKLQENGFLLKEDLTDTESGKVCHGYAKVKKKNGTFTAKSNFKCKLKG